MERADGNEKLYWIWLQLAFGCGSHRINAVADAFCSAREVYELSPNSRMKSRRFTKGELEKLERTPLARAQAVLERCNTLGCDVLTPEDARYPERLRNIFAMPAALYCMGALDDLDNQLAISMVGTRTCTDYGQRAGAALASSLAKYGTVIVSGLALGIDTACIRAAIEAGGKTIGVLGSGIDLPYPPKNTELIRWMPKNGHVVLTEYPPGEKPLGAHFPVRNRIITGLTLGTVVVEAPMGSGALISASHALEQGKDIFVVPARIEDTSFLGSLELIAQGAKAVLCGEDVLSEYERLYPEKLKSLYQAQLERIAARKKGQKMPPSTEKPASKIGAEPPTAERPASKIGAEPPTADRPLPKPPGDLDETQRLVFSRLSFSPVSAQELAERTGLSVSALLPVLTELEIFGVLRTTAANRYILCEA